MTYVCKQCGRETEPEIRGFYPARCVGCGCIGGGQNFEIKELKEENERIAEIFPDPLRHYKPSEFARIKAKALADLKEQAEEKP